MFVVCADALPSSEYACLAAVIPELQVVVAVPDDCTHYNDEAACSSNLQKRLQLHCANTFRRQVVIQPLVVYQQVTTKQYLACSHKHMHNKSIVPLVNRCNQLEKVSMRVLQPKPMPAARQK